MISINNFFQKHTFLKILRSHGSGHMITKFASIGTLRIKCDGSYVIFVTSYVIFSISSNLMDLYGAMSVHDFCGGETIFKNCQRRVKSRVKCVTQMDEIFFIIKRA